MTVNAMLRNFRTLVLAAALAGAAGCASTPRREPTLPPERQTAAAMEKLREAERAERKGDETLALQLYREAIELDRRLPVAWNDFGTLLLSRGNYLDAVQALRVAADLDPTDPRPLYNIGTAYARAGWAEEALEAYESALRRDPNHLPSLRGAVQSASLLSHADIRTLERTRRALLIERDDQWRTFFERERFRIEGQLRERRKAENSPVGA